MRPVRRLFKQGSHNGPASETNSETWRVSVRQLSKDVETMRYRDVFVQVIKEGGELLPGIFDQIQVALQSCPPFYASLRTWLFAPMVFQHNHLVTRY